MTVVVRTFGCRDYTEVWHEMRDFVAARTPETPDEFWFVEHPPVFTLGLAGSRAHLLAPGDIPVVASDRGGQVTYHGPRQLVAYVLLDLRRLGLGPRELVRRLESALIATLAEFGIPGTRRPGAPGVYVADAKIASLGLRIRNHCSYHGLALNVDPDLEPFSRINPCGYTGMRVTSLAELGCPATSDEVRPRLELALRQAFEPAGARAHAPVDNGTVAAAVGHPRIHTDDTR
ncbi:MAG: lipoyl(octanoyl) transferase LipB [Gammaproteobacteria bacterium]